MLEVGDLVVMPFAFSDGMRAPPRGSANPGPCYHRDNTTPSNGLSRPAQQRNNGPAAVANRKRNVQLKPPPKARATP